MLEVLKIISEMVLLLGLFYFAWLDYKTGLLHAKSLLLFGSFGVFLRVLSEILLEYENRIVWQWDVKVLWQIFWGMLIGGILLMIALVSRESIGIGDGLLFIATGTFLNFTQNLALLFGALLLIGIFSVICLLIKKKGRNDRVALVPFVLIAYVVFIL